MSVQTSPATGEAPATGSVSTMPISRALNAGLRAALAGREFALPDDVQSLAVAVLAHRLLPTAQAQLNRRTAEQIVLEILHRTPVPDPSAQQWRQTRGRRPPGVRGL